MGMFDGLTGNQNQNNAISVLKDLLDSKNIEMKTDLNIVQVKVLFQLKLYLLMKDSNKTADQCLEEALVYLLELMCSIGRMSRKEITDAVKEMKGSLLEDQNLMMSLGRK